MQSRYTTFNWNIDVSLTYKHRHETAIKSFIYSWEFLETLKPSNKLQHKDEQKEGKLYHSIDQFSLISLLYPVKQQYFLGKKGKTEDGNGSRKRKKEKQHPWGVPSLNW